MRIPLADASLHKVPEGVDEKALVMLSDIGPTGYEVSEYAIIQPVRWLYDPKSSLPSHQSIDMKLGRGTSGTSEAWLVRSDCGNGAGGMSSFPIQPCDTVMLMWRTTGPQCTNDS